MPGGEYRHREPIGPYAGMPVAHSGLSNDGIGGTLGEPGREQNKGAVLVRELAIMSCELYCKSVKLNSHHAQLTRNWQKVD